MPSAFLRAYISFGTFQDVFAVYVETEITFALLWILFLKRFNKVRFSYHAVTVCILFTYSYQNDTHMSVLVEKFEVKQLTRSNTVMVSAFSLCFMFWTVLLWFYLFYMSLNI
jgi:hypothetical protein